MDRTTSEKSKKKESAGTAQGLHGIEYEINFIILLLVRGLSHNLREFTLNYQVENAGAFDDVVFYEGPNKKVRYIQLKHKIKDKFKITDTFLLKANEKLTGDFSFLKYVISYNQIENNDVIEPIIFTNISLDTTDNGLKMKLKSQDDDMKLWYKNCGFNMKQNEKIELETVTILDSDVLKFNQGTLYKVNDKKVHQILAKQYDDFKGKIVEKFTDLKGKTIDIEGAIKNIIYAVGQPNLTELVTIIVSEIKSYFNIEENEAKSILEKLQTHITDWVRTRTGYFPKIIEYANIFEFFQENVKLVSFDVIDPSPLFTGRENELNTIKREISEHKIFVISQEENITNFGGIGKTELARMFVQLHAAEFYSSRVIFITATNPQSIEKSIDRLGSKLKLDFGDETVAEKIKIIFQFFEHLHVLFVFQAYDQEADSETQYIPLFIEQLLSNNSFAHLLFTTTKNFILQVPILNLSCLEECETIRLLRTVIEHDSNVESKKMLYDIYQGFSISLVQAITYMTVQYLEHKEKNDIISTFINKFYEKREHLSCYNINSLTECEKTAFVTLHLAIDAIKTNNSESSDKEECVNAITLLKVIAIASGDKINPYGMNTVFKDDGPLIEKALRVLEKYKIVTDVGESGIFHIHPLMLHLIQITYKDNRDEIVRETIQAIDEGQLVNYDAFTTASGVLSCVVTTAANLAGNFVGLARDFHEIINGEGGITEGVKRIFNIAEVISNDQRVNTVVRTLGQSLLPQLEKMFDDSFKKQ